MKIAILAAGENRRYFPLIFNKPKCLYHLNGSVKLGQVIDNAKQIVSEKDIIVVAGYKNKYIKKGSKWRGDRKYHYAIFIFIN